MHTARSLSAFVVLVSTLVNTQSPIVDLGYGQYQGAVNLTANITSFLGIRFAAPPLGDLRWRAPQPPVSVPGLQPATAQPNQCTLAASKGLSPTNPLESRATGDPPETEDCLFVSVYYPSDAAGTPPTRLPTLVWLHGGGYIAGRTSVYNGGDIIKASKRGVVVVLVQYRLGIFGFLSGTAVKNDGALNAGLLDQQFAMRWVNEHIAKFGGDPAEVTIWGQSAGAGSVIQHIIANGGHTEPQLFKNAITSSTFLLLNITTAIRSPMSVLLQLSSCGLNARQTIFNQALEQTNCTTARDSMACLRGTPSDILERANNNISAAAFYGTFALVPVVDGEFIQQSPIVALRERKVNGEALLSITNAFEGVLFVNQSVPMPVADYALQLFPGLGEKQANTIKKLYGGLGNDLFQVNALQGESIFICPTYYLLDAFHGRAFKGEFAVPPATHASDLGYYFPSLTTLSVPAVNNTVFTSAFADSFMSFIVNHDPNAKLNPETIAPRWKMWHKGSTEMLFNITRSGEAVVLPIETEGALLERCRFWNGVGDLTGQ
ncbi:Alpha/Beta hydrolase protein [Mycena amicta]|nr:Alpha/Beta hydrolase protein [Mycena amicta]